MKTIDFEGTNEKFVVEYLDHEDKIVDDKKEETPYNQEVII